MRISARRRRSSPLRALISSTADPCPRALPRAPRRVGMRLTVRAFAAHLEDAIVYQLSALGFGPFFEEQLRTWNTPRPSPPGSPPSTAARMWSGPLPVRAVPSFPGNFAHSSRIKNSHLSAIGSSSRTHPAPIAPPSSTASCKAHGIHPRSRWTPGTHSNGRRQCRPGVRCLRS